MLLIIFGTSSCKKEEANQPSLPCIIAGESIPLPSEAQNKNVECCEGLSTIPPTFPSTNPEEHISSLPEGCGISVGPTPICSDCGNEKCESWENKCNCPKDCTEKCTENCSTDDYYIHGTIGVGFKKGTTQQEAETVLKKYGLTFVKTDDLNLGMHFFYESGEKFAVKTGEGNEDYWISILQKEESVYSASWLPNPDKVLVD